MNKLLILFAIFVSVPASAMDCTLSRVLPFDNNLTFENASGAIGGWKLFQGKLVHTASAPYGERYRNVTWQPTLRFSAGEEYTVSITVTGIDGGRTINVLDRGALIGAISEDGSYEFDFVAQEDGFLEINRQETTGANAFVHRVELTQEVNCGLSCDGLGLGEFFGSFSCPSE